MRRAAVIGAVVVLVLGALLVVRPFVAAPRDQPAEIVSPAALARTDTVELAVGHPVCFASAVIEQHSQVARFKIGSATNTTPPIDMTIKGAGYDFTAKVPAGTVQEQLVSVPVTPPPTDVIVEVCFSNRGTQPVSLFASSDRTRSRSLATVDGEVVGGRPGKSVWFGFYEATPRTIVERLPTTLERMTVFRPHYVTRGVLWVLAVLLLVGVPVGIVWGYQRALRDDERLEPRELDVKRRRTPWQRFVG
jgi:hypothetical protein